jgi:hypothetical protein
MERQINHEALDGWVTNARAWVRRRDGTYDAEDVIRGLLGALGVDEDLDEFEVQATGTFPLDPSDDPEIAERGIAQALEQAGLAKVNVRILGVRSDVAD